MIVVFQKAMTNSAARAGVSSPDNREGAAQTPKNRPTTSHNPIPPSIMVMAVIRNAP